jgi:hypothetical protein
VAKGLTGQFEESVNTGGTNVTVLDAVVNGVKKNGTSSRYNSAVEGSCSRLLGHRLWTK